MLALHRRLLALRRATPALTLGTYEAVAADGDLLAYQRRDGEARLLVVLNLGPRPASFEAGAPTRTLLSTHLDREGPEPAGALTLRADEGLVLAIEG